MALRPAWQGHLKLSLVTCPVALYTAIDPGGDVHFHLVNPKTSNRIRMVATDPDTGPVDRSELVKGYEVADGEYVLVTDEEIKAVKLRGAPRPSTSSCFVPAADIDRIYWDNPYYLAPDGKLAQEAFAVIRQGFGRTTGQIALGRGGALHPRTAPGASRPRGEGILATSLRSADEVREAGEDLRFHRPRQERTRR